MTYCINSHIWSLQKKIQNLYYKKTKKMRRQRVWSIKSLYLKNDLNELYKTITRSLDDRVLVNLTLQGKSVYILQAEHIIL